MATDELENSLRFLLSYGNRNGICLVQKLLEPFELSGKQILADKGYDSDEFVRYGRHSQPRYGRAPRKTDWHTYKGWHLIEKLFLKLKNHRCFSTRCEKKAVYFHAVVSLACVFVRLI